jgi:hypothetical protein
MRNSGTTSVFFCSAPSAAELGNRRARARSEACHRTRFAGGCCAPKSNTANSSRLTRDGSQWGLNRNDARDLLRLSFLAPDVQAAIVAGRPTGLSLKSITRLGLPAAWSEQRRLLGMPAPSRQSQRAPPSGPARANGPTQLTSQTAGHDMQNLATNAADSGTFRPGRRSRARCVQLGWLPFLDTYRTSLRERPISLGPNA